MIPAVITTLRNAIALDSFPSTETPYEELRAAANRLAVRPWVTTRLIESGSTDTAVLRDHHQDTMRRMAMLADLVWLARALSDSRLDALLIKGAALVAATAQKAPWRHTEDIDIVAPPGLANAVHASLLQAGASYADLGESIALDGSDYHLQVTGDHHALFPLCAPMGTMVDVHRMLPSRTDSWARVARRSVPVSRQLSDLRMPGPADHLTILSEHSLLKHRAHPAALARHMLDTRHLRRAGAEIDSCSSAVSVALLESLELAGSRGTIARSTVVPSELFYQARSGIDGLIEQGVRLERDLRWRPRMLLYKLAPHADYMDAHFGPVATPQDRIVQHAQRWKHLVQRGLA
jgi:molybdopterin-guanine dinucleotide biosynthesis protein